MFNKSEIMTKAWARFRTMVARAKEYGFAAPKFGAALREVWIEAKAIAVRIARAAKLAAMDGARAELETQLDDAVFLPMGKSFINEVNSIRTKIEAL